MKFILTLAVFALSVLPAAAGVREDQAAVAALVPGAIVTRPWGWVISGPSGATTVVRQRDGYAVSGPTASFTLTRRRDGFAIAPQSQTVRVVPTDRLFDNYYAGRKRR